MIVMGLTGKAGAGKSAVADYLVEQYGFTKLSFAGPLKKMLRTLDPILEGSDRGFITHLSDLAHLPEAVIKTEFPEYRRLLQVLGTDCIRALDEDFWVRAAMKQLTDVDGRYVFDDVRFPNEAEAVLNGGARRADAELWYIDRPGHDSGVGSHESEQHAGRMDETWHLTNPGKDIEGLQQKVDDLMSVCFPQATPTPRH